MGLVDIFKTKRAIVLEEETILNWYRQLAHHNKIENILEKRFTPILKHRHRLLTIYKNIDSRYKNLSRQSDRVFYDNYQEFMGLLKDLLDSLREEKDILEIENFQRKIMEKITSFEEDSRKSVTVLKPYLEKEILALKETLKLLEDDFVEIAKTIEDYKISDYVKLKEMIYELLKTKNNIVKLQKEKKDLIEQSRLLEEKKKTAEERIAYNKDKIRNKSLLVIIDDVIKIEKEKRDLVAKYRRLVFEIKRFFVKNALKTTSDIKDKLSTLTKNAEDMLKIHNEDLKATLEKIEKQILESNKEGTKEIIEEIKKTMKDIFNDSKRLNETETALRNLKKEIIKDVHAINIYEQSQIIKTIAEQIQDIKLRIGSIEKEIEESNLDKLKERIKNLVEPLGAMIKWKE